MLLQTLASIATKLGLNEDQIFILHAFNRGILGKLGMRQAQSLVNDIVERYELDDYVDSPTYGAQLVRKGILTTEEGYLFAEGYLLNATSKEQQPASRAEAESPAPATSKAADPPG